MSGFKGDWTPRPLTFTKRTVNYVILVNVSFNVLSYNLLAKCQAIAPLHSMYAADSMMSSGHHTIVGLMHDFSLFALYGHMHDLSLFALYGYMVQRSDARTCITKALIKRLKTK